MRYEGNIYRPPSEAYSLIIQVTIGCAHNDCTFCSMYKDKVFRVRKTGDVLKDLAEARSRYKRVDRIFLADGDALVLSNEKLMKILDEINQLFPECERINVYGSPQDVLKKTPGELKQLYENGIKIIYIGAESGSDHVLKAVCKGATRAEITEAVKRIEASGIKASVTFISGLGGRKHWQEHAVDTGTMISQMEPSYVGLLTLMLEQGAPMKEQVDAGEFQLLSPEEVVAETLLLLKHATVKNTCVFRSNHASNYVSLRGDLPKDKDQMIASLRQAMEDHNMLKDECFRRL